MLSKEEIESQLPSFTGTGQWYRVSPRLVITDGIRFVLDNTGGYWLSAVVNSIQTLLSRTGKDISFQNYTLKRVPDTKTFNLIVDDGNNNILYEKVLVSNSFPLDSFKFYYMNNIMLLPSEY